jgi:hypothetical protein
LYIPGYAERKVSFVPLENSVVEVVNEKKNMFSVKDKFNSTVFRTTSKEDMFGWYLPLHAGTLHSTQAVRHHRGHQDPQLPDLHE